MQSRRAFLGLLAGGCLATSMLPAIVAAARANGPQAPNFVGLDGWLNTPAPITIAGLRDRVVLVDFWTYSCINCRRTVPYLNRWQAEYGPKGLQVVGIHTPEFGFEQKRPNVAEAVRALSIQFPVGQDNGFQTWQAWGNEAWPAFYLVDQRGRIVLVREGEGYARELEAAIRALLSLPPATAKEPGDDPNLDRIGSPEVYLGALHPTPQDPSQHPIRGDETYAFPTMGPQLDEYQLAGAWRREKEALLLRSSQGRLRIRFSAAKLHLVASSPKLVELHVSVDNGPIRAVQIQDPTLYTLFDSENYGEHVLEFGTDAPGLALFSITFG